MSTVYLESGSLVGKCPKCKQHTTGKFDSDDNAYRDEPGYWVELQCVNCLEKTKVTIDPVIYVSEEIQP